MLVHGPGVCILPTILTWNWIFYKSFILSFPCSSAANKLRWMPTKSQRSRDNECWQLRAMTREQTYLAVAILYFTLQPTPGKVLRMSAPGAGAVTRWPPQPSGASVTGPNQYNYLFKLDVMSPSPQSPPPLASYNTTFYPAPQYLKRYSFVSIKCDAQLDLQLQRHFDFLPLL